MSGSPASANPLMVRFADIMPQAFRSPVRRDRNMSRQHPLSAALAALTCTVLSAEPRIHLVEASGIENVADRRFSSKYAFSFDRQLRRPLKLVR